jgi:DNA-binding ferritin-like protein (Dps family)
MDTIEDVVIDYLKNNYEDKVKELFKKVYEVVSGNKDLIPAYLGEVLRFFLMDEFAGKNIQNRLIRLGLASVDWEEVAEEILNLFEEAI